MAIDAEAGLANLRSLRASEEASCGRNEATTRFQVIDRLLREVLGWEPTDCECEAHREGDYADYILGNPRRFAVWEAKREGKHFSLPVGLDKTVCKLETLRRSDEFLRSAIEQVQGYAQLHGLGIAVVCNGHQIIAFLGSRHDGIPPFEGNALCFMSWQKMEDEFQLLWDNLSKPGVESSFIYKTLRADGTPLPPEKLSASIHPYPGLKNRNDLQFSLKQLGDLFLFDLATLPSNEEEFLESCYASTGALSQNSLVSKEILETRYSLLARQELVLDTIAAAQTKHGLSDDFSANLTAGSSAGEVAAALKRRPIIVLGDVGVGKTIFLRHLIKVTAKEELKRAITLYVDFLKEPAFSSDLQQFVQNRCEVQLRNDYGIDLDENKFVRDVYRGELVRFGRGVYGPYRESNPALYTEKEISFLEEKIKDRASHLRASLEQIVKAHHRQIVLFLDNIDQRSVEFQEQVYVIGHALAETWPIVTFICLRPDTFYSSRNHGSLSAYQPRAFSITPPRIDAVIVKRLQYALFKMGSAGRMENFPPNISINSPSLRSFLESLIRSLQTNSSLIELLDNLSGRNVRKALDSVNTFIGSGHVDSRKIIDIQNDSGYTVAEHEFLRAVIYGDHEHFDPSSSQVCNLFDISLPDGREHFLLLILLSFVERSVDSGEGYVSASAVFAFAQSLEFSGSQIYSALGRAARKALVETAPKYSTVERWEAFRITPIGAYSIKRLVESFSYVDAMIVDTPIIDRDTRESIKNVSSITQRLERFDAFVTYLERQAGKLDWSGIGFDWKGSLTSLKADADKTRRKAGVLRRV
jgi:hypothetical protein